MYLVGGNTRRIRGALVPRLKTAPFSKSAVSRLVTTLKADLDAWLRWLLDDLAPAMLSLDALTPRVRSGGKVVSVSVLAVVAMLADGHKRLLTLELYRGESFEACKGGVAALGARDLTAPVWCIIEGQAGRRRAVMAGVAGGGGGPALLRPQAPEPRAQGHALLSEGRDDLPRIKRDFLDSISSSPIFGGWTANNSVESGAEVEVEVIRED